MQTLFVRLQMLFFLITRLRT